MVRAKSIGSAVALMLGIGSSCMLSAAVVTTTTVSAKAAEGVRPSPKRVRPRAVIRQDVEVFAGPEFRTNHIPGVWRGETRLPWVGPGLCHDARTSERVYCIMW